MRVGSVLLLFVSLAASSSARADTYQLFDLNATLENGGTLTGTVNLDLDTTLYYAQSNQTADLVYTLGTTSTPIMVNNESLGSSYLGPETQIVFQYGPGSTEFVLVLPTTTPFILANFPGGICTGSCASFNSTLVYNVTPYTYAFNWVTSGTFTPDGPPVSDTPEPTSLMLLGTAAFGMIGAARRSGRKPARL